MTRFLDGPAAAVTLSLKRAPIFLRVTEENGEYDALDQLEDEPRPRESIHVYRREGGFRWCHILRRPRGSGFYTVASYRYFTPQPPDADVRTNERWRAWANKQPRK